MTEQHQPPSDLRLRAVVPAPPNIVYEALTDPAALRVWLAEHADVQLPGKYEFWGRYTPDGAEPHQRVLHVDERTIRFAWTVDGVETTAQFELAEDEDGTLVTLSQSDLPSFQDVLADTAGARGALQTFWSLAIANLADYLSGRELTPKCDFTSAELHASVVIDAAPDKVFDSMIQPELFRKWFGANVDIEPYVGGRFAMGGFELDPGGAKFVEFEPGGSPTTSPLAGSWKARTARPGSPLCTAGSTPPTRRTRAGPAGWAASPDCGATTSCPACARSGARSRSPVSPRACWRSTNELSAPGRVPRRSATTAHSSCHPSREGSSAWPHWS
jgi:uncharacterized protein YndB with AHSA1/START domain